LLSYAAVMARGDRHRQGAPSRQRAMHLGWTKRTAHEWGRSSISGSASWATMATSSRIAPPCGGRRAPPRMPRSESDSRV